MMEIIVWVAVGLLALLLAGTYGLVLVPVFYLLLRSYRRSKAHCPQVAKRHAGQIVVGSAAVIVGLLALLFLPFWGWILLVLFALISTLCDRRRQDSPSQLTRQAWLKQRKA
jgi:hypothetical protein